MAARLSSNATGPFDLHQNAEINVTPFVDVMLVLVIIFMVVAAVATSAVKVDLPTTGLTSEPPKSPVTVSLTADGGLFVNDRPATMSGLPGAVAGLINDGRHDDRVVLRADKAVSYERFMDAMSRLSTGGIGKLALMSEVAD